jgi:hypothetical protein
MDTGSGVKIWYPAPGIQYWYPKKGGLNKDD